MTRYKGPNAALVNEVVDLWFSNRLLSAYGPPEQRPALKIVTDIGWVIANAKDTIFPVDPAGEAEEDFDYYWGDLLSNLTAECIYTSEWYEWKDEHAAAMRQLDAAFNVSEHVETRLPANLGVGSRMPEWFDRETDVVSWVRGYVCEEVGDILHKCAENRAFNGRTENFWEQVFQLYDQGLWPCGWEGRWPSPGRIVAWRRLG